MAALIVIVGIHMALTERSKLSAYESGPNKIIEEHVNHCWMAKLAKNIYDCKVQIAFIENQCRTNPDYIKADACKDPRILEMIREGL